MNKDNTRRLEDLEKRVEALEKGSAQTDKPVRDVIEIDTTLPEADIDGLHFNEQKVRAVFEYQDDGWWQSRGILFLSARNVTDDNSQDILMEYLNSYDFKNSIRQQLPEEIFGEVMTPDKIEVSLPKENKGIKKYHGVDCWHWLAGSYSDSAADFCLVNCYGLATNGYASTVLGCSPAFRVAERHS
jgi:hypothetical protein